MGAVNGTSGEEYRNSNASAYHRGVAHTLMNGKTSISTKTFINFLKSNGTEVTKEMKNMIKGFSTLDGQKKLTEEEVSVLLHFGSAYRDEESGELKFDTNMNNVNYFSSEGLKDGLNIKI